MTVVGVDGVFDQVRPPAEDLVLVGAHRADLARAERHQLLAHVELAVVVYVVGDEEELAIGRVSLGKAFGRAEIALAVPVFIDIEIIDRRIEGRVVRAEEGLVIEVVGRHAVLHADRLRLTAAVEIDAVHRGGEEAVSIDVDPGFVSAVGAEEQGVEDVDARVDVTKGDARSGEVYAALQRRIPDLRRRPRRR